MIRAALRRRRARPGRYDPARERAAEARARELLRSAVSLEEFEMYAALGFIAVPAGDGEHRYAYLLYPHRPIVAYAPATGELLSEYCVTFRDRSEPGAGERLPDADDVLARWMALRANERALIAEANVREPGRAIDPGQVRRDLAALAAWRRGRS